MLQRLQQLEDPSVTYDVVAAGIIKGASIDLECVLVLLPLLMSLLDSTYEDVVLTAMRAVSHLSLSFGPLIKNTRGVAQDMLGGEYRLSGMSEPGCSTLTNISPNCGSGSECRSAATALPGGLRALLWSDSTAEADCTRARVVGQHCQRSSRYAKCAA